ncbi:MAG: hypothetical protein ACYCP0_10880 [Acidiferrobacteraceae bacterium]
MRQLRLLRLQSAAESADHGGITERHSSCEAQFVVEQGRKRGVGFALDIAYVF